jgi:hypothetical protein
VRSIASRSGLAGGFLVVGLGALCILATPSRAQQTPTASSSRAEPTTTRIASAKDTDKESEALLDQLGAVAAGTASPAAISIATSDAGVAGIVPVTKGFNASLVTTSQHDSSDGWSSLLSPDLAYRFSNHFSINVDVPAYLYINVVTTTRKKNAQGVVTTVSALADRHFVLGDTTLTGGFDAHPRLFDYNLTATLGMPTGDDANGLGAGQFTYAFINHFERSLGDTFTPNIELGIDDSPNLTSGRVLKSYEVVGTSAHFQAGVGVSLPWKLEFETDAYEELPLGTQTVTSTTTQGKKGKQVTTTSQKSIGEDNGFTNALDIPLNRHVTLSGFYNRSLRNRIDTAGFSLTFLLRPPPSVAETK